MAKITRESLKAGAKELGIKVTKSMTDKKIQKAIEDLLLKEKKCEFSCSTCGKDLPDVDVCPFCGEEFIEEEEVAEKEEEEDEESEEEEEKDSEDEDSEEDEENGEDEEDEGGDEGEEDEEGEDEEEDADEGDEEEEDEEENGEEDESEDEEEEEGEDEEEEDDEKGDDEEDEEEENGKVTKKDEDEDAKIMSKPAKTMAREVVQKLARMTNVLDEMDKVLIHHKKEIEKLPKRYEEIMSDLEDRLVKMFSKIKKAEPEAVTTTEPSTKEKSKTEKKKSKKENGKEAESETEENLVAKFVRKLKKCGLEISEKKSSVSAARRGKKILRLKTTNPSKLKVIFYTKKISKKVKGLRLLTPNEAKKTGYPSAKAIYQGKDPKAAFEVLKPLVG